MPDSFPSLSEYFIAAGNPLQTFDTGGTTPLEFSGASAEHLATRQMCGLFDFSFMGAWEIKGPGVTAYLERLQTRNLDLLQPGQIAYTLMCRDDGSIFNDATVWMLAPEHFLFFSGRKSDAGWINDNTQSPSVNIVQIDGNHSVLALQGPMSGRVLSTLLGQSAVRNLRYFRFIDSTLIGAPCRIGRIGYSGELGYEIVIETGQAARLWMALCEAGRPYGLLECGFRAADSLRIESGYILFSSELAHPRKPVEVGLARWVDSNASGMRGRAGIAVSDLAHLHRLVTIEYDATAEGSCDYTSDTVAVTSMAFSPHFGKNIGLAFATRAQSLPGTRVVTQNGVTAKVCTTPLYDPSRRRPRSDPLP